MRIAEHFDPILLACHSGTTALLADDPRSFRCVRDEIVDETPSAAIAHVLETPVEAEPSELLLDLQNAKRIIEVKGVQTDLTDHLLPAFWAEDPKFRIKVVLFHGQTIGVAQGFFKTFSFRLFWRDGGRGLWFRAQLRWGLPRRCCRARWCGLTPAHPDR